MGPRWLLIPLALLFVLSFALGLSNSILFYETLPHEIPAEGIVVFYQPSCPHCIAEIPVIKRLVAEGYPVYSINALKHPEIARQFGVVATPTIVILPSGVTLVGEQSYEAIVKAYEEGIASSSGEACGVETYTCGPT